MRIAPLGNRYLIKPDDAPKQIGSIILPENTTEKNWTATVLACPASNNEYAPKVGNKVLYAKHAGYEMNLDGQDCIILEESDILGVFESSQA